MYRDACGIVADKLLWVDVMCFITLSCWEKVLASFWAQASFFRHREPLLSILQGMKEGWWEGFKGAGVR